MFKVLFFDADDELIISYLGLAHVGDWGQPTLQQEIQNAKRFLKFRIMDQDLTEKDYSRISKVRVIEDGRQVLQMHFNSFLQNHSTSNLELG